MNRREFMVTTAATIAFPAIPSAHAAQATRTYTGAAMNISIACSVPATQDADFEALEWTPVRTSRSVPIQGIRQ